MDAGSDMQMIHPTAIIGDGAEIAGDVRIGAYCVIGGDVRIGAGSILHPHVVVDGHTEIGKGNEIFSFTSLGAAPQHLRYKGEPTQLIIGDNNIIREHITMHRGTVFGNGKTVIGNNNIFMTGCHVAHDCIFGNHILAINDAKVAGHAEIGNHVYLAACCGVKQFTRIGDHAMLAAMSGASTDIIPFGLAFGTPVASLVGLNIVGLKSRGFDTATISNLRTTYGLVFESDSGTFKTRLGAAEKSFGDDKEVMQMLAFIRKSESDSRPLCHPKGGAGA